MSSLQVTLPEELRKFVESEAAAGGFDSPGTYVQELLRAVWRHKEKTALEENLIAASEGGPPVQVTPEFWEELKARVRRRAGAIQS